MPFDGVSLVVISAAAGLIALAWRRGGVSRGALGALLLATLLIRLDPAWQRSLHPWDEQYHALVAKNLLVDPLQPTLYRDPAIDYDYTDWTANHVWLHKPPLALWWMAGSMKLFGVDAVAMRVPSILAATASVLLTFLIGRVLLDVRVGLLAATFHAVNGFVVALASGRRVADHVDTALLFFFELSIYAAILSARRGRSGLIIVSGVAIGCGLLSKSLSALIALPVIAVMVGSERGWSQAVRAVITAAACALLVAAPWNWYAMSQFPREFAWENLHVLRHVTERLEEAPASRFSYFMDMPRFFGESIVVSLVLASIWVARRDAAVALRALCAWAAIPYVTFSLASTRMPGYVMVAAPALFLIQAYVWWRLADGWSGVHGPRRLAAMTLLALMVTLPARYLLEPTGVFERRDRWQVQGLRDLERRAGPGEVVVFNVPNPFEVMFYSPYTAYSGLPTEDQLRRLSAAGRRVVILDGEQPARQDAPN